MVKIDIHIRCEYQRKGKEGGQKKKCYKKILTKVLFNNYFSDFYIF